MNRSPKTTTAGASVVASVECATPQKRARLSLACNSCRRRKVRCDAELPQCRNCRQRGDSCKTTNPRRPDVVATRRWASKDVSCSTSQHQQQEQEQRLERERGQTTYSINTDNGRPDFVTVESPAASTLLHAGDVNSSHTEHDTGSRIPLEPSHCVVLNPEVSSDEECRRSLQPIELLADDHTPDMMVIRAEGSTREKYMGSSSLQCLCAFADVYLARRSLTPISSKFHHGMKHAEEFKFPLQLKLPEFPSNDVLEQAIETFSRRILPLYPVIDCTLLRSEIKRLRVLVQYVPAASTGILQQSLSQDDLPVLCSIYCVITIGVDEQSPSFTEDTGQYLAAAYGLLGHLNAMPYINSVQALFLLSIALRGRGKEGQAWHILGQAIRITHSIGLHKRFSRLRSGPKTTGSHGSGLDLQYHIWWSCYALERQMELEMGRPSSIRDLDNDEVPPLKTISSAGDETIDYHAIWVALAHIFGQISEHIFRRRSGDPDQLLYDTGRLDQALQAWADALPGGLRPIRGITHLAPNCLYSEDITSFLLLQFHQAQITLFRASLVLPQLSFIKAVQAHGSRPPSYSRLLRSYSICIESARSILQQVLEMADNGTRSWVFTTTQIFLAILVLIINVLKHPHKRIVRSDRELVKIASELIQDQWRRVGQNADFIAGCDLLCQTVDAAIKTPINGEIADQTVLPSDTMMHLTRTTNDDTRADENSHLRTSLAQFDYSPADDPFHGVQLEELWTMIGTDFGALEDFQPNQHFF